MKAKARFHAKGQSDAMHGRCAKLAHLPRWAADAYRAGHREGLQHWMRTTVRQLAHIYARPGGRVSGVTSAEFWEHHAATMPQR